MQLTKQKQSKAEKRCRLRLCLSNVQLYMGCNACSDVSEFEHIYGQILTTSSCVYGRLFTWTRMVDF